MYTYAYTYVCVLYIYIYIYIFIWDSSRMWYLAPRLWFIGNLISTLDHGAAHSGTLGALLSGSEDVYIIFVSLEGYR